MNQESTPGWLQELARRLETPYYLVGRSPAAGNGSGQSDNCSSGFGEANRTGPELLGATLMAESEEKLKSLLVKVKNENEKVGLKLSIQETKTMASGPIT